MAGVAGKRAPLASQPCSEWTWASYQATGPLQGWCKLHPGMWSRRRCGLGRQPRVFDPNSVSNRLPPRPAAGLGEIFAGPLVFKELAKLRSNPKKSGDLTTEAATSSFPVTGKRAAVMTYPGAGQHNDPFRLRRLPAGPATLGPDRFGNGCCAWFHTQQQSDHEIVCSSILAVNAPAYRGLKAGSAGWSGNRPRCGREPGQRRYPGRYCQRCGTPRYQDFDLVLHPGVLEIIQFL